METIKKLSQPGTADIPTNDNAAPQTFSPQEFLKLIFEKTHQDIELRSFSNSPGSGKPKVIFNRNFDDVKANIGQLDKTGRGLFFGTCTRQTGINKGARTNVVECPIIWLDIDKIDKIVAIKALKDSLLPPTFIIDSGNGVHAYWLLQEPLNVTDVDGENERRVKSILKHAARIFSGDVKVCELARVMRLPGSHNSKPELAEVNSEGYLVKIVHAEANRRYDFDNLEAWMQSQSPLIEPSTSSSIRNVRIDQSLSCSDRDNQKPPLDIQSALSGMKYGDAGNNSVHQTQLRVSSSMVMQGATNQQIFDALTPATKEAAGEHGSAWNWEEEERKILGLINDARKKWNVEEPEDWVAEINKDYMVLAVPGKTAVGRYINDPVLNRPFLEMMSIDNFRQRYNNLKVQVGDKSKAKGSAWLESPARRQYLDGVHFAPNQDLGLNILNLWTGFGVMPKKGNWSLMKDHIFNNICCGDKECFEYVMGWLAYMVQNPGKQGEVAICLRGGRGTGKSIFGKWICQILGRHSIQVTNTKHLVGNFNSHLEAAVFVFADEAFYAGDRGNESVLKSLITEDTMIIEKKGFDAYPAKNTIHLLMASNDDWVVPAGSDERRFFVLDISDAQKKDLNYFAGVSEEAKNGGLEALLYDLLEYDLYGFDPRQVPKTNALTEQKIHSLKGVAAWLHSVLSLREIKSSDKFESGHQWRTEGLRIKTSDAYHAYATTTKSRQEFKADGKTAFGKKLHNILGANLHKDRAKGDTQDTGRPWFYLFGPLSDCRQAFEKYLGSDLDWDEDC